MFTLSSIGHPIPPYSPHPTLGGRLLPAMSFAQLHIVRPLAANQIAAYRGHFGALRGGGGCCHLSAATGAGSVEYKPVVYYFKYEKSLWKGR